MKKASISTLKNQLSHYIAYVRKGGVVRVFDRDQPVAEIVPFGAREGVGDDALGAILLRLEQDGAVRQGRDGVDLAFLDQKPLAVRRSVADAIIEERREGR